MGTGKRYRTLAPSSRYTGRRRAVPYKRVKYTPLKYGKLSTTELKFHDLDIDDAAIAANGTIVKSSVLTIAEGNGESNRIGRKIIVKNINWRYTITLNSTAVKEDTSEIVRVILYLDKQTNGAIAAVSTDAGILETDNYQSFNNLNNKNRFRILSDRTYHLRSQSGSGRGTTDTLAFGEDIIEDQIYKKCDFPIEYDNSTTDGALTSMRSNNVGVLLLSKGGFAVFDSKMRIRYLD